MSTDWEAAREICLMAGAERLTCPAEVALGEAAAGTLAGPVFALSDLPGFTSSAMDGWVVAGDGPWQLGEPIRTGDTPPAIPMTLGWARAICTGAPVPPGPVAVLRSENGVADGRRLVRHPGTGAFAEGTNIRRQGEEARAGELLLPAGARMTPAALALAAVAGVDAVALRAKPTVSFALLGREIVDAGVPPAGQVRDAFGIQLPHLLQQHGADIADVIRASDDEDATVAAFSLVGPQLIISTGGSAHGMTDHVRNALAVLETTLLIDGVAMRPGHPVMLAARPDGALILSLPGNPLAAMITLITLGLTLIDGMLGRPVTPYQCVVAGEDLENPSKFAVHVTGYRLEGGHAVVVPFQGSGMLRGLAAAEGLAVVPPGGTKAGEAVLRVPLPWSS